MTDGGLRDLVVVGASAGGVEALRSLVSRLPQDFPACMVVVLHVPPSSPSALAGILDRAGPLPARQATNEAALTPGTILVAPPDHHVIIYDGAVTLSHGPHENGHRPAIDVLFRSAARARAGRTVGVVLSGALDDGAAGMLAIARRGGACVVQDFAEALHDSMPRAAAAAAPGCQVVRIADMADTLTKLVGQPAPHPDALPLRVETETATGTLDADAMHTEDRPGRASGFACPDCHGALFEIDEGPLVRFRCRVGHAWSPESLAAQQVADLESALWMALGSLEERAGLSRQLAARARDTGHGVSSDRFRTEAEEAVHAAELVRELIGRINSGETLQAGA